jgi:hypothetical protein
LISNAKAINIPSVDHLNRKEEVEEEEEEEEERAEKAKWRESSERRYTFILKEEA